MAKEEILKEVLKVYWKYRFYHSKRGSCKQNEQSVERLREFTKEMISQIVGDVYTPMNQGLFCTLRNLIACRLTLLNTRREGEATRVTM